MYKVLWSPVVGKLSFEVYAATPPPVSPLGPCGPIGPIGPIGP